MKSRLSCFLTLFLGLMVQVALAQEKTISGTVTDGNGTPLPGVNITVEGTSDGTQTDFDGNYELDVEEGQVLLFSSVGFEDQNVTVGDDDTIDISLQEGTSLDEVVVTALGISRDKKSLGYSTQEISSEKVTATPTTNFSNALAGKVSGLNIRQNNNFGGSTNTIIRGTSSITGNNQALYVVDGVPVSNENTNTAAQEQGGGTAYDYGNAASDINPQDIESVNVLKGAAATALYGNRAANGVIEITTKSGKKEDRMGVTINSNVEVGFMDKDTWPEYQTEYGAGYSGQFDLGTYVGDDGELRVSNYRDDGSYGPKFDGEPIYQWDAFDPDLDTYGKASKWESAGRHGPYQFFETPVTLTNSVAISNGTENGSYRLSYTNQIQEGSMPNQDGTKNDVRFNGDFDVTDKLHTSIRSNYIKSAHTGRNSTGYSDNIVGLFRQWWETNVDIKEQENAYKSTGRNITWNPSSTEPGATPLYWDNAYWTRYENYQNDSRSRFLGNVTLDYEVADWFTVTGRAGTDTYNELQEERRAKGSNPDAFGVVRGNVDSGYLRRDITFYENNFDLLLNFTADISDKIDFTGLLGGSIRRNNFSQVFQSTAGGLLVPDLYSLQNGVDNPPNPVEIEEKTGTDSFYGRVTFGYEDMLYLDATLREDHFSTLPSDNSHIWYPSVSASFVFSELMNSKDFVNFGQFRINYAEVGKDAEFDRIAQTYAINDDMGASRPTVYNNAELKPERNKNFEAGVNMKFFDNRLGFDLAVYNSDTEDQIFNAPVVTTTGYASKLLNAGSVQSKGLEFTLNATPVKTEDWQWDIDVNWAKDKSEVKNLPEGTNSIIMGSYQGGITIEAVEGQPLGIIRGTDFEYNENGEKLVDDNGYYINTSASNVNIGDTNPDWKMGISNDVSWKNLSFGFLIDWQKGGDVFSLDQYYGENTGLYPNSAGTNERGGEIRAPLSENGGYLFEGVKADGSPNDTYVDATDAGALGYGSNPDAAFVYDASYIKLREISISYDLPEKVLENTFLTGVQFSLTGNNLWIIHKNLPYADPEAGLSSGNLQGYITGAMPTFRRVGFNARLQF